MRKYVCDICKKESYKHNKIVDAIVPVKRKGLMNFVLPDKGYYIGVEEYDICLSCAEDIAAMIKEYKNQKIG